MAKKKAEEAADFQVSIRVDDGIVDRADALIDFVTSEIERASGGAFTRKVKRSDVLRSALLRGLAELEKQRNK